MLSHLSTIFSILFLPPIFFPNTEILQAYKTGPPRLETHASLKSTGGALLIGPCLFFDQNARMRGRIWQIVEVSIVPSIMLIRMRSI